MFTPRAGTILIAERFEERSEEIVQQLLPFRSITFIREDFKIEDAKEVIAEAYRSEERTKTLILGAKSFTIPAQNALLKILEEPPHNIAFILLAENKSTFLPTVRSRLTMTHERDLKSYEPLEISLRQLDLSVMFDWIKKHDRTKKHEAKALVERVFHHAVFIESMELNVSQLEAFEKALKLIEVNARTQSVLVMIMMTFLKEIKRVS